MSGAGTTANRNVTRHASSPASGAGKPGEIETATTLSCPQIAKVSAEPALVAMAYMELASCQLRRGNRSGMAAIVVGPTAASPMPTRAAATNSIG